MERPATVVVVVEDDDDVRSLMEVALRQAGFTVYGAASGEAALIACRQHRPDAVLLDVGLPGMDGYAVETAIRADEALQATRIVYVSGREDVRVRDYIRKPFGPKQLAQRVNAALGR